MKKLSKIAKLISISTFLLLVGCSDLQEIDQRAYVLGIGLDKAENEEGMLKITYLISNPEAGSTQQGGGSTEPTHEIISFNATSFIQSQNIANAFIAKEITYDILDFFIVSEELARDNAFIRWIYDATKDREIRRDTKIMVSKENAFDFIEKNKPKLETRRHEYFEIMFRNANTIGLIPMSSIHQFFRITEADADLFIAAYGTTEKDKETTDKNIDDELIAGKLNVSGNTNPAQFLGSAVFKEGQMIGTLTVEETRIAHLLNKWANKPSFLVTFQDPFLKNYWITARYTQLSSPQITTDVSTKQPKITVTVPLQVEILTDHSMVNYAKHEEKRKELKEHITKRIEKKMKEFVKRTQEEFKANPFGFSLVARKHFLTIPEWEEYDWMKAYPEADVSIKVDIKFGEFGRQSKLPEYNRVRD